MQHENLIIIGGGPAGYTAGIYASRAMLKPLLIEGPQPGGQLMLTTDVENWPGYPDGILGPDMMQMIRKQAERFGTRFVTDSVIKVDFSVSPFFVKTTTNEYTANAVIIATGASALWLGVPGEDKYKGRGVSSCATCDGFFFREKSILVIGGGDSAMEEALFLTKFATQVKVLVRSEALRASVIMQERAKANPKISFVWNTAVEEVLGDGTKMTGVKARNLKTGEVSTMDANGLFLAIGHKPNTEMLKGQIDLDAKGYVIVTPGTASTSVPGVYAGGDVADYKYRQAITASGTGCMAALEAEKYLAHKE